MALKKEKNMLRAFKRHAFPTFLELCRTTGSGAAACWFGCFIPGTQLACGIGTTYNPEWGAAWHCCLLMSMQ
eukprot:scaffold217942_cov13-Tisochrysis_lutea.AAC.1